MTAPQPPAVGETRRSAWLTIDQAMIDRFADATGDRSFIHVDPEQAAQTPFGGTIAHGFLLLSLVAPLYIDIMPPPAGTRFGLNYGIDRLRFLRPVPAGSRVRLVSTLDSLDEKAPGQLKAHFHVEIELDGADGPALSADWIVLYQASL